MARQKSEERTVAKGRGNAVPTRPVETGAGAKAFPVNEEARQLLLHLGTAEESAQAGTDGEAARTQRRAAARAEPKSRSKQETTKPATIDLGAKPRQRSGPSTAEFPLGCTWAPLATKTLAHDAQANRRPGPAHAELGYDEVANRPAAGVITGGPEEPYVKSTSTVL